MLLFEDRYVKLLGSALAQPSTDQHNHGGISSLNADKYVEHGQKHR